MTGRVREYVSTKVRGRLGRLYVVPLLAAIPSTGCVVVGCATSPRAQAPATVPPVLEQKPAARAALAAALTEVIGRLDVADAVICIDARVSPEGDISPDGYPTDPGPLLRDAIVTDKVVVETAGCPETYGGR